jgi:hypothetical protein
VAEALKRNLAALCQNVLAINTSTAGPQCLTFSPPFCRLTGVGVFVPGHTASMNQSGKKPRAAGPYPLLHCSTPLLLSKRPPPTSPHVNLTCQPAPGPHSQGLPPSPTCLSLSGPCVLCVGHIHQSPQATPSQGPAFPLVDGTQRLNISPSWEGCHLLTAKIGMAKTPE